MFRIENSRNKKRKSLPRNAGINKHELSLVDNIPVTKEIANANVIDLVKETSFLNVWNGDGYNKR